MRITCAVPGWWSDRALDKALQAGGRLQVNASSLLGAQGVAADLRALALVGAGHATVLSSDAHSPARPPCLTPALEALSRAGVPADALVKAGPAALLEHGLPRSNGGSARGGGVTLTRQARAVAATSVDASRRPTSPADGQA